MFVSAWFCQLQQIHTALGVVPQRKQMKAKLYGMKNKTVAEKVVARDASEWAGCTRSFVLGSGVCDQPAAIRGLLSGLDWAEPAVSCVEWTTAQVTDVSPDRVTAFSCTWVLFLNLLIFA
uniref:Uncharacterized protein n=1 Tax=Bursaphelenchus xylophilus TaxID=6326 RepID=A0A1I7S450_BURXY